MLNWQHCAAHKPWHCCTLQERVCSYV